MIYKKEWEKAGARFTAHQSITSELASCREAIKMMVKFSSVPGEVVRIGTAELVR